MDIHKGLRACLLLLLVLTLVFGMIPAAKADKVSDAKEKLDALQEEKDALDADISDLQSQLSDNLEHMELCLADKILT